MKELVKEYDIPKFSREQNNCVNKSFYKLQEALQEINAINLHPIYFVEEYSEEARDMLADLSRGKDMKWIIEKNYYPIDLIDFLKLKMILEEIKTEFIRLGIYKDE